MARFNLKSQKFELSESDVVKQCLDVLRLNRFLPLRLQSGRFIMPDREVVQALKSAGVPFRMITVGEVGIPDYVALAPEYAPFFLEFKRPGAEAQEAQAAKALELARHWRLNTRLVDNVNQLIEWLDLIKNQ